MRTVRFGLIVIAGLLAGSGCAWISPDNVPAEVPLAEQTSLPTAPLPTVSTNSDLAAKGPSDVAASGVLTFVTEPQYAPMAFTVGDNLTIVGADVELGTAVAKTLGLEGQWSATTFDRLLPSVEDGDFDASMSALTITSERLEDVNMVSYLRAGLAWAVAKGNPEDLSIEDACGHTVAVQRSTVQADDVEQRSADCTAAGKPAITIVFFAVASAATEALLAGEVDALVADGPVMASAVAGNSDVIEQLGEPYDEGLLGIAVSASDDALADVVQQAVQALINDGTYGEILDRWGLADNAITTAELNPVQ